MIPVFPLPRLVFGAGVRAGLPDALALLGVEKPLLVSDRGLEQAGVAATVAACLPAATVIWAQTPENPTTDGVDAAFAVYVASGCDGVVALGGGSVIDTAKFVAALAAGGAARAEDLLGRPDSIGRAVAPLIAIPTTIGTGSESSPVSALHLRPDLNPAATRSPKLVPRVAVCDPDLARTLPPRLIANTGLDALSHCLEGYFAEPAHPLIDALALDGLARAYRSIRAATAPQGDDARAELMLAAFAGGVAIHKGLGPAHAAALACSDQHLHHGALVAIALPLTVALLAAHVPDKADRAAAALGCGRGADLAPALQALNDDLGVPRTYLEAGYRPGPLQDVVDAMTRSHFNRSSPYAPTEAEYRDLATALLT